MKVLGIVSIVAVAVICVISSSPVRAQVDVFAVERMQASYRLEEDQTLLVKEDLLVDFSEQRHGIIRYIPAFYDKAWYEADLDLNPQVESVTDIAGNPLQFTSEETGGYLSLKIGDPNAFVIGTTSYSITYRLSNVVQFFDEGPELYLDINGTEWTAPFKEVIADIELPEGYAGESKSCYTGPNGSQEQQCVISQKNDSSTRARRKLNSGVGS
jgi:hypothetical protein